jgi:hypothetical protein
MRLSIESSSDAQKALWVLSSQQDERHARFLRAAPEKMECRVDFSVI